MVQLRVGCTTSIAISQYIVVIVLLVISAFKALVDGKSQYNTSEKANYYPTFASINH